MRDRPLAGYRRADPDEAVTMDASDIYDVQFFDGHGFAVSRAVQRRFRDDQDVAQWYRDNMLLFVRALPRQ